MWIRIYSLHFLRIPKHTLLYKGPIAKGAADTLRIQKRSFYSQFCFTLKYCTVHNQYCDNMDSIYLHQKVIVIRHTVQIKCEDVHPWRYVFLDRKPSRPKRRDVLQKLSAHIFQVLQPKTLNMEVESPSVKSVTINQSFRRYIPEYLNLRQHDSANLISFTHLNYNSRLWLRCPLLQSRNGRQTRRLRNTTGPPYPNSPVRRDKAQELSDTEDRRHPITSHEDPEGDLMYSSTLSLTWALIGGVGVQRHAPRSGTQNNGGWVGTSAGLDGWRKSRPPTGFDPRTVQSVASSYTDWAILGRERRIIIR